METSGSVFEKWSDSSDLTSPLLFVREAHTNENRLDWVLCNVFLCNQCCVLQEKASSDDAMGDVQLTCRDVLLEVSAAGILAHDAAGVDSSPSALLLSHSMVYVSFAAGGDNVCRLSAGLLWLRHSSLSCWLSGRCLFNLLHREAS